MHSHTLSNLFRAIERPGVALGIAMAIGVLAVAPFLVFDSRFILEPDLLASQVVYFYGVIGDGAWLSLPPQPPGNVYFEGNLIIYAFATRLFTFVQGLIATPVAIYDAAKVTVGIVNALAHVAATVIFFSAALRLTRETLISLLVTVLFALSPQIVNIDLVRSDRLILLGLTMILYGSLGMTVDGGRRIDGILLGLGTALVLSIKFTGVVYGIFPATALVFAFFSSERARLVRTFAVSLAVGVPVLMLLMIRHVLHPGSFVDFLVLGYREQVGAFDAFFSSGPLLYYNIDLFGGYGVPFLLLMLIALAVTLVHAAKTREAVSMWLLFNLVLFSILGIVTYKYERGGYHLVPLYLFVLARAAALARSFDVPKLAQRVAPVLLLVPVVFVAISFSHAAARALDRPASITKTRIESRAWIAEHYRAGDRICMLAGSEWSNPHLDGLGLFVTTKILDVQILNVEDGQKHIPPGFQQLRATCDGVVIDDFHKKAVLEFYRLNSSPERLADWQRFFDELEGRHPPKIFEASTPAYWVARVDVHDLRPPPELSEGSSPLDRVSRRDVLDGSVVGDSIHIRDLVLPIRAGGFAGGVDHAARYEGGLLAIFGWTFEADTRALAAAIIVADGEEIVGYDGTGTAKRPDVAEAFSEPVFRFAGFATCIDMPASGSTEKIRVFAIGYDGAAAEITGVKPLPTHPAPPGAGIPFTCRSSEVLAFW